MQSEKQLIGVTRCAHLLRCLISVGASHPEQSVSLRYVGETVLEITRTLRGCVH